MQPNMLNHCIWEVLQESQLRAQNGNCVTDSGRSSEDQSSNRSSGTLSSHTEGSDACDGIVSDLVPELTPPALSLPHEIPSVSPISRVRALEAMRKDELYCPYCFGGFLKLEGVMGHVRSFGPCRAKWDRDSRIFRCDSCQIKVRGAVALVVHEYQEHYNPSVGVVCPGCFYIENHFSKVCAHIESLDTDRHKCGEYCRTGEFSKDANSCSDCSFTCTGRLPLFVHRQECEARPPGLRKLSLWTWSWPLYLMGWCAHCDARFTSHADEWRHHQASPECFRACSSEPATLQCLACCNGVWYNRSQFWAHIKKSTPSTVRPSCFRYHGGQARISLDPRRAVAIAHSAGGSSDLSEKTVREAHFLSMQDLWTALGGEKGINEAMDIIGDQIERRSNRDEGWMGGRSSLGIDSGATPIVIATLAGRGDVVAALIGRGANVGATTDSYIGCFTALHAASASGDSISMMLLIEAGADMEARDEHGCTPLFYAARKGRYDAVELLLGRKANVNAVDSRGKTLLHAAAGGTHNRSIALLVAAGARAANRNTLWLAVVNSLWPSVHHLVSAGADLTVRDSGHVLLHTAIQRCDHKMVAELIAAGANVNDCDRKGIPALSLAVRKVGIKIVAALISAGASLRTYRLVGEPSLRRSILNEAVEACLRFENERIAFVSSEWRKGYKYLERLELIRLLRAEGCE